MRPGDPPQRASDHRAPCPLTTWNPARALATRFSGSLGAVRVTISRRRASGCGSPSMRGSPSDVAGGERMADEPKAIVQRLLLEGFNKGNWTCATEIIAPDVQVHRPFPDQEPGRDGLLEQFAMIRAAYPDMQS